MCGTCNKLSTNTTDRLPGYHLLVFSSSAGKLFWTGRRFWSRITQVRSLGWWERMQSPWRRWRYKRMFTYEEFPFLLLILSTRTVMVMPMRTPAASNNAITLMTSPVAICGRGFSREKTHAEFRQTHSLFTVAFGGTVSVRSNDQRR